MPADIIASACLDFARAGLMPQVKRELNSIDRIQLGQVQLAPGIGQGRETYRGAARFAKSVDQAPGDASGRGVMVLAPRAA